MIVMISKLLIDDVAKLQSMNMEREEKSPELLSLPLTTVPHTTLTIGEENERNAREQSPEPAEGEGMSKDTQQSHQKR